ncbi:MAG: polysaccharide pyruvyl transferase family protein [Bacteroidales bacterium]|jgi:hypothetical protein|nr:polysaccharide pyruvyl transferase family protein [Bacteroidales bacterium]
MNNVIKTYYCNIPNAGDQLNSLIVKELWGKDIVYSDYLYCDLVGIGSILDGICIAATEKRSDEIMAKMKKNLSSYDTCYIWSSGFMCWAEKLSKNISHNNIFKEFYRKNIVFKAIRGELSKGIAQKIYNKPLDDIVLADGGLLSSLISKNHQKFYPISIIPHWTEIDDINIFKLLNNYKYANLIDIRKDPIDVIKEIANSEIILSSSLHGLIIADSFNIPNKHIIASSEIRNRQSFKYHDYYSSYGLPYIYIDIQSNNKYPSINNIIDNYPIKYTSVKEKQNYLIQSFPF